MAQNLIVGLIVAVAALYVLWRYLPQRWRGRLGRVHASLAKSPGCGSGSDGACASCGSCGSAGGAPLPDTREKPVAMPSSHRSGG
ncbi:hypothetical protein [Acidovorax sp. Leaf160]|uniref:hypothetical protein n=1 Tax=Acidovorax sp. Leaf160 TaxID=1736280 RepID=UPI0009E9FC86|nr:hypothetical protein [Acidovorax sp. Leaf160]